MNLTPAQHSRINKEMDEQVVMLTDEEVDIIAKKVNKAINLPFIGEEKEFVVFVKVVKWVDRQLYKLLPNEYYSLIKNTQDGVTQEEAKLIEKRVTPLINERVNIPVLSESQEEKLIGLVLSIILKAMVKGFKLEEAEH